MKSGKKIYVIYQPGSFGSWVRWLIEFGNDLGHQHKFIPEDPILIDGSSHSMITLFNAHPTGLEILETLDEIVTEPCGYKIYRSLPIKDQTTTTDMILQGLIDGKDPGDKVIYIDVDGHYNKMLLFLNLEIKTTWLPSFNSSLVDKVKQWDPSKSKFEEIERWQQRELVCLYYEKMIESLTKSPKDYDNVLVIKMTDIFEEDVVKLTERLIKFCDLPVRENINSILYKAHDKMLSSQTAPKFYQIVLNTVDACMQGKDIPIPPLSLFAEAMVQNLLLKKGKEIKCYQLNEFPSTTGLLMELII